MFRPFRIPVESFSADRIIATLNEGRRIIIEFEVNSETYEVELGLGEGGVYYADAPLLFSTHQSEDEIRRWLITQGYATE